MNDYSHVYDSANSMGEDDQKDGCENKTYMALKSLQEENNVYEQPQAQVSVPRMEPTTVYENVSTTGQHHNDHPELSERMQSEVNKKRKKPIWFITICVLIFVAAVFVAFAIGTLTGFYLGFKTYGGREAIVDNVALYSGSRVPEENMEYILS